MGEAPGRVHQGSDLTSLQPCLPLWVLIHQQARQPRERECHPTHKQIIGLKFTEHGPAHQSKTQFFPHQSLQSGSLHKPFRVIHQRTERRSEKNHNPTVDRTKIALQKVNQNEKAEIIYQMKGQDKTTENN